jgi:hypothetical protein
MATYNAHMCQAEHNEEVAKYLLEPHCFSEAWTVIVSFYAALQYVEAAFFNTCIKHSEYVANESKDKSPHTIREELIQKCAKEIYADYKELRKASEMFRYLKDGHSYFKEEDARKLFQDNLVRIKHHLQKKKLIYVA